MSPGRRVGEGRNVQKSQGRYLQKSQIQHLILMLDNEENKYEIVSLIYDISWYGDDDNATLLRKK